MKSYLAQGISARSAKRPYIVLCCPAQTRDFYWTGKVTCNLFQSRSIVFMQSNSPLSSRLPFLFVCLLCLSEICIYFRLTDQPHAHSYDFLISNIFSGDVSQIVMKEITVITFQANSACEFLHSGLLHCR